jgi:hypothetical protein
MLSQLAQVFFYWERIPLWKLVIARTLDGSHILLQYERRT